MGNRMSSLRRGSGTESSSHRKRPESRERTDHGTLFLVGGVGRPPTVDNARKTILRDKERIQKNRESQVASGKPHLKHTRKDGTSKIVVPHDCGPLDAAARSLAKHIKKHRERNDHTSKKTKVVKKRASFSACKDRSTPAKSKSKTKPRSSFQE